MPIKKITFILFVLSIQLCAQTIRPTHWLDDDLRYYWNRAMLWDLSPLTRPYTAHEIRAAMDSSAARPAEFAVRLLKKMPALPQSALAWVTLDNAYQNKEHMETHFVQRAMFGAQIHPNLHMYNSFFIDNHLDADTSYIGKRQSGVSAYMEQAFLLFDYKAFRAKFGRDFLVWGPGLDAALHLSHAPRPLDHLYLSWQNRWICFAYFTSSLDRTEHPVKGVPSVQNRYLSGHRIEVRPWKFLRIGMSETALFGGPDVGVDFALMNPLLFYNGVQSNGPQDANVLGSLDAVVMPLKTISLYASLAIDDIQIENQTVEDQEPAQVGVLAGVNWADPFAVSGLDLYAEYTRVTNRTYSGQGGMWEKHLHRNVPIGHFLGNDFDRLIAGVRYRTPRSRYNLTFESRRRGEGRVQDVFTTPWRQIEDGETYSEPFPTGIVESADNIRFSARWHPVLWLYGDLFVSYWQLDNVENQHAEQDRYWEFRVQVSIELLQTFSIL